MKRIFPFAALFISLPVTLFSQVQKGDNFGTFDASFRYQHSNNHMAGDSYSKSYTINYSLDWGIHHFVANRFAIGSGFTFNTSTGSSKYYYQGEESSKSTTTIISVGLNPSIRYYLCDSTRLNWFFGVEGICNYFWNRYTNNFFLSGDNEHTTKINGFEYGGSVSFGSVYFITRNIGLEGQVYYTLKSFEYTGDASQHSLDHFLGISAGMMIYLGKSGK